MTRQIRFQQFQQLNAERLEQALDEVYNSTGSAVASVAGRTGAVTLSAPDIAFTPPYAGAVPSTAQAQLARSFHVDDFGAVGDGVTDDRAAIQAALDACFAAGAGFVKIGPKRYRVGGANLQIPVGVTLVGEWQNHGELEGRNFTTQQHALLLESDRTIRLAWNSGLKDLAILRFGMTTPTDVRTCLDHIAAMAGTAITSRGAQVRLDGLIILGFDRAIDHDGWPRPTFDNLSIDCRNGYRLRNCYDVGRHSNIHIWPYTTTKFSWTYDSYDVASLSDNGSGALRVTLSETHPLVTGDVVHLVLTGYRKRATATVISNTVIDFAELPFSGSLVATNGKVWPGTLYRDGIGVDIALTDGQQFRDCFIYGQRIGALVGERSVWTQFNNFSYDNYLEAATDEIKAFRIENTARGTQITNGYTSSCATALEVESTGAFPHIVMGTELNCYNQSTTQIRIIDGRVLMIAAKSTAVASMAIEAGADHVSLVACDFPNSTLTNSAAAGVVIADTACRFTSAPPARGRLAGRLHLGSAVAGENVALLIEAQGADAAQGAQMQFRNTSGTNNTVSIRANPAGNLQIFNNAYSQIAQLTQAGSWQPLSLSVSGSAALSGGLSVTGATALDGSANITAGNLTVGSATAGVGEDVALLLRGHPTGLPSRGAQFVQNNPAAPAGQQQWTHRVTNGGSYEMLDGQYRAWFGLSQGGAVTFGGLNTSAEQIVYLQSRRTSPAPNDLIAGVIFQGNDSTNTATEYAALFGQSVVVTNGAEEGALQFRTRGAADSAPVTRWTLRADGLWQDANNRVFGMISGSPEGVVTAGIGSWVGRIDGGAGTSFYVKESGTGNTGWVPK